MERKQGEDTHTHKHRSQDSGRREPRGEKRKVKLGEPGAPAGIQLRGTRMAPPGASGPAPPQAGLSGSSLRHGQGPAGSL